MRKEWALLILVTGATGFTRSFVVERLIAKGFDFACFVRPTSDTTSLKLRGIDIRVGTLEDYESFFRALRGVDTLVNIASLGFGHAPNIVKAAEQAGVRRAIFVSTTAIFTSLDAKSKAIRTEAERLIISSQLEYTIIRPTMIYGTERDRNMCRLIRFINRSPIIPIPGSGKYLQQPVYVEDVADAIIAALSVPKAVRQIYNIAGAMPLEYNAIIEEICKLLGKRRLVIHLPVNLAIIGVTVSQKIPGLPKFTVEQVLRLNENKAFDIEMAKKDLGFNPLSFQEGIRREIERLRAIGFT